jgi:hypothetical protein
MTSVSDTRFQEIERLIGPLSTRAASFFIGLDTAMVRFLRYLPPCQANNRPPRPSRVFPYPQQWLSVGQVAVAALLKDAVASSARSNIPKTVTSFVIRSASFG